MIILKFVHPVTGVTLTTKEAAEIIGIHPATLCNRYKAGQRGAYLWRPKEFELQKNLLPSNKLSIKQDRVLRELPSETDYERDL